MFLRFREASPLLYRNMPLLPCPLNAVSYITGSDKIEQASPHIRSANLDMTRPGYSMWLRAANTNFPGIDK